MAGVRKMTRLVARPRDMEFGGILFRVIARGIHAWRSVSFNVQRPSTTHPLPMLLLLLLVILNDLPQGGTLQYQYHLLRLGKKPGELFHSRTPIMCLQEEFMPPNTTLGTGCGCFSLPTR